MQSSLVRVIEVMEEFTRISGLHISASKSLIYVADVGRSGIKTVAITADINVGAFPIRYLGLPLTTKSMSQLEYESLVD